MDNRIKWTFEKLQSEALKYETRGDFQKYGNPAYQAAKDRKILDSVCIHMKRIRYPWTNEELALEALKYSSKSEFEKGNKNAYQTARRRFLLDKICSHMENKYRYWTNEELSIEALKYLTRKEFEKSSPAYGIAQRRGILEEICCHMKYVRNYYTNEELHKEALKYDTRSGFHNKNPNMYNTALLRGILDQICTHMKRSRGSSEPEEELFEILKKNFPDLTKTFFKIDFPDKPHIKRFQIDIYNPTTKKGVEYDGPYHHSEKHLVKSKTKDGWPIEDAINYHIVKDKCLKHCHDIDIIHIKHGEWIKNKETCIKRCINFLKLT
jgi:hypothetical protein